MAGARVARGLAITMDGRFTLRVSVLRLACVALTLLLASSFTRADTNARVVSGNTTGEIAQAQANRQKGAHLTADDTIQDLLSHPAFAGFGRLLLPWDDRTYDDGMRLRDVGSLLPYHTHVDPATVVTGLNHMIDDVNSGKTVFYDFYTDDEKAEQPAKSNTGLFFFRGQPGAPFAVISPGGGFSYVGSVHEGFPYAVAISKQGYNAFVLRYRAGSGGAVATRDLAAAISYVFRNAQSARRRHRGLFLVGQLGRRQNGGRHRLARGREIWRRRPSQAVGSGDGLHGPFGVLGERAAHLCRRRRARWNRSSICHGKASRGATQDRHGRRVPSVQRSRSWLRSWCRYKRRRMAGPCDPILGEVHRTKHSALGGPAGPRTRH